MGGGDDGFDFDWVVDFDDLVLDCCVVLRCCFDRKIVFGGSIWGIEKNGWGCFLVVVYLFV